MFAIKRMWTDEELQQIDAFLKRVYALLSTNEYHIERTEKNKIFDRKYPLRDKERVAILKSLSIEDCIDISPNINERYPNSLVFEFIKDEELLVYGETEMVKLYIKQYIMEKGNHELVAVISFHEEGLYDEYA